MIKNIVAPLCVDKRICTETTRFVEAYKCSNSHIFTKYTNFLDGLRMDSMTFYKCCPKCGSTKINIVTGQWKITYKITGYIFKKKTLIDEYFYESE